MMPGSWGRETGRMQQGIGQLAEASKEGLGSERAVVPMMMMMMRMVIYRHKYIQGWS
jgi:hypothetical protein